MALHIKVEVDISTGTIAGGNIVLPADDNWLARMRASVATGDGFPIRLDNCPVDGSTGMIALTLGPYCYDPESEEKHMVFSSIPSDSLFGVLLDARKLAELIAALQLMQAHFPADEGVARG